MRLLELERNTRQRPLEAPNQQNLWMCEGMGFGPRMHSLEEAGGSP